MQPARWVQYDDRLWMLIREAGGHVGFVANHTPDGATEETWAWRTKDSAGETYSRRSAMRTVRQAAKSEEASRAAS